MKFRFLQKGLALDQTLPRDFKVGLERYSWNVYGGPAEATLTVEGNEKSLPDLLFFLRNGVEIYEDAGMPVWWGYVSRVEIPIGDVLLTADIEEMANKVSVAYTLVDVGGSSTGVRRTTTWQTDTESVYKYGIRELLESGTDLNLVSANGLAKRKLAEMKVPQGYITQNESGDRVAKLTCKGWWNTLDWRYVKVDSKLALSFTNIGKTLIGIGPDRTAVKLAQSFTPVSDFAPFEVGIYVYKVGNPGSLTVAICENKDDPSTTGVNELDLIPGAVLTSASVDPLLVGTTANWVKVAFGSSYTLQKGVSYFLKLEASGTTTNDYYVFTIDETAGYGAGGLVYYPVGASVDWTKRSEDLPFELYVNQLVETTQQIQNYLNAYGQFIGKVRLENKSNYFTESYRSGDTTAKVEAEAHLENGTAQYKRLLARVNADRTLLIWEQPEQGGEMVEMQRDGKLYYRTGGEVEPHFNPVGRWISTEGVIARANTLGTVAGLQSYFCESAEWDSTGRVQTTPANWKNPYSVRVQNG